MDSPTLAELIRRFEEHLDRSEKLYEYAHTVGHKASNVENALHTHITLQTEQFKIFTDKINANTKEVAILKNQAADIKLSPAGREVLANLKLQGDTIVQHDSTLETLKRFMYITLGSVGVIELLFRLVPLFLRK